MHPIQQNDLVRDVLARDERLVDILARHAAHFAQLRDPAARRTMGALVTVEQAAKIAGVTPAVLVGDLNAALGVTAGREPNDEVRPGQSSDAAAMPEPRWSPSAAITELDVREDLRSGREPFTRIMSAIGTLPADHVLLLRTTFEPAPLFAVLARRGFLHASERHADDDWSVRFWRPVGPATGEGTAGTTGTAGPRPDSRSTPPGERVHRLDVRGLEPSKPDSQATPSDDDVHWLDVRGLEPPEPMVRTLALLEALPDGHTVVQVNVRAPQFLLPILTERGFAFSIDDSEPDRVLVRIHRGP